MGTSEKVSTPPAMTVDAWLVRIFSAADVMATEDEMHAFFMSRYLNGSARVVFLQLSLKFTI